MTASSQQPLVSVLMTTFAHEKTIVKAIEGVLLQQADFKIELIIANDASPDATHALVEEFMKKATIPNHITVHYTQHETNKGMMDNIIWALKQVKGKYIALCEGDDYWIDFLKLAKQVDFLENNNEYGLVHTNYKRYYAKTGKFTIHTPDNKHSRLNENEYYLYTGDMRTCTVLFRTSFLPKFKELIKQDFMNDAVLGDRPFFLFISKYSKIYFINEITSVYYITASNSASNFEDFFNYYDFLKKVSVVNIALLKYLQMGNSEYIENQQRKISFYEVLLSFKHKNYKNSLKLIFSRTGTHFWNIKELKELYGLSKNR